MKEKRKSPRLRLELEGNLARTEDDRAKEDKVFTKDISAGGVYLLTDTALQVDEPVEIELLVPSSEGGRRSPVVFSGTVVRIRRLPDGKFGLAIRFNNWLLDAILESSLPSIQ